MSTAGDMTIGELALLSGVPAKTIRYYEETGVIGRPRRSENHYRTYGESDVQTLRFISEQALRARIWGRLRTAYFQAASAKSGRRRA